VVVVSFVCCGWYGWIHLMLPVVLSVKLVHVGLVLLGLWLGLIYRGEVPVLAVWWGQWWAMKSNTIYCSTSTRSTIPSGMFSATCFPTAYIKAIKPQQQSAPPPPPQLGNTVPNSRSFGMEAAVLWLHHTTLDIAVRDLSPTGQWNYLFYQDHHAHLAGYPQYVDHEKQSSTPRKPQTGRLQSAAAVNQIFFEAGQDPLLQALVEHITPKWIMSHPHNIFANGLPTATTICTLTQK